MKSLLILLILLTATRFSRAQAVTTNPDSSVTAGRILRADLDKDPVFRQVASSRIHYPVKSASRAVYGRFYAGFTIDTAGHIQQVSMLYPKMSSVVSKRYGFEDEILAGLKHMPPLNPRLAGNYILPVAFCYTHYAESPNPIIPTNVLPPTYNTGNRILLSEVRIFAKSPSSTRDLSGFPASRQIGQ